MSKADEVFQTNLIWLFPLWSELLTVKKLVPDNADLQSSAKIFFFFLGQGFNIFYIKPWIHRTENLKDNWLSKSPLEAHSKWNCHWSQKTIPPPFLQPENASQRKIEHGWKNKGGGVGRGRGGDGGGGRERREVHGGDSLSWCPLLFFLCPPTPTPTPYGQITCWNSAQMPPSTASSCWHSSSVVFSEHLHLSFDHWP